jgi:hypothetical protein
MIVGSIKAPPRASLSSTSWTFEAWSNYSATGIIRLKNAGAALEMPLRTAQANRRCAKYSHTVFEFCYRCEKFTQGDFESQGHAA